MTQRAELTLNSKSKSTNTRGSDAGSFSYNDEMKKIEAIIKPF
jgi:hypothetical protein